MVLGLLTPGVHAATESRLALLIGNSSYKNSPLVNPVNDVRLMEVALKESGFTVIKAENASIRDMRRLVRDFGDKLKATGGVGLFYFAGHGVQVRGENFLVSTDSDIRNEDEVADDSINANVVLEKMQSAGNRVNLVILDACRNNPFAVRSRTAVSGLANMSAPSGSLVAYSTAPGSVASDGSGKNGLYTEHLAKVIRQPGLPVEEVFKQVRAAVRRDSNNQQTPWENTALEGQFFFRSPAPQVAAPAPEPAPVAAPVVARPTAPDLAAMELALWDSVKVATSVAEFQAYLNRFPNGFFADVARARIAAIGSAASDSAAARKAAAERATAEAAQKAAAERLLAEANQKAAIERANALALQKAASDREKAEIAASQKAAAERAAAELAAAEAQQRIVAEDARKAAADGQQKAAAERATAEAARKAEAERLLAEANQKAATERATALALQKATSERVTPVAASMPLAPSVLGSPAVGDMIGTLVIKDGFTGNKVSVDVTVLQTDATKVVYSTGDVIARDGQVLRVKVGEVVLQVTSGALWKIPVKAGTAGVAQVRRVGEAADLGDTLKWRAIAAPSNRIQIVADVSYHKPGWSGVGSMYLRGEWLAMYASAQPLPISYSTSVSTSYGGPSNSLNNNKNSAELTPLTVADQSVAAERAAAELAAVETQRKAAAERVTTVAASMPTAKPELGSPAVGDVIGTLVTKDSFTGNKVSVDVTVLESDATKIVYSTGDMISRDGQVLRVKVGDAVLQVVSGALWKIPVKVGTGVAQVRFVNDRGNFTDTLKWTAAAAPGNQIQIVADVSYRKLNASGNASGYFRGGWSAMYASEHPLPVSYVTNVNGTGAWAWGNDNKNVAELSLR